MWGAWRRRLCFDHIVGVNKKVGEMKIEINEQPRMTIEEFADLHDLTVDVNERTPSMMGDRWTEESRYYAQFRDSEIKEGRMLAGTYGNGCTPEQAISDYASEISEKLLVLHAFSHSQERREIWVPVLIQGEK